MANNTERIERFMREVENEWRDPWVTAAYRKWDRDESEWARGVRLHRRARASSEIHAAPPLPRRRVRVVPIDVIVASGMRARVRAGTPIAMRVDALLHGETMDAVKLLIDQHRAIEAGLSKLQDAEPARRAALLAEVGDHLSVHIAAEEELFYPAANAARTEHVLLESLEEHLSLKRLLADLLELSPGDETFEPKVEVLKEQSEHHHQEEEKDLFPKVRSMLDQQARDELGDAMFALQQRLQRGGEPRERLAGQTDKAAPLE